jgi:hypothetical protein
MLDIMRLTPDQLERYIHLQSIVDRQQTDADKTRALRAYYTGEHPVMLTQRQQEYLGPLINSAEFTFAHNLVRVVVNTLSERLSVNGFSVNGVASVDDDGTAGAAALWTLWKSLAADLIEQELYPAALRDGRAYMMVDFDAETQGPRWVMHEVDDGRSGIIMHRDPGDPRRVLFATRYWWTFDPLKPGATGIERKTVYLPGEIRKYRRGGAGQWQPVQDDDDPTWPLPWVHKSGEPMGVNVIEFANPGGAESENFIGMQNALNKSWLDLLAAADSAGFPVMVAEYMDATGMLNAQGSDADITGADELNFGPGRLFEIERATVKRIEAANLTPMLDVIWALTAAIAGVSRTPQYYLRPVGGADVPSGEAIKQLESGLVARAVKRQRVWGQAWEEVLRMTLRVAETFGAGLDTDSDASITVEWEDPNTRNELSMAQTAQAHKALGVPDEQVWQVAGYSPEEIAEFKAMASADKAAQVAGIAAALRTQQIGSANNGGTGNALQQGGQSANRGVA